MQPKMIVIAGAPGSGKSAIFPGSGFGIASFNADDRAAALNAGSFHNIPATLRQQVNREFQDFVLEAIRTSTSFAIETTLRSTITFDQARLAKAAGFSVEMRYMILRDFALHLERVKARADSGGHSASEETLRGIYEASIANFPRALGEMDSLSVFDNSQFHGPPTLVLEARDGVISTLATELPDWLAAAVKSTTG